MKILILILMVNLVGCASKPVTEGPYVDEFADVDLESFISEIDNKPNLMKKRDYPVAKVAKKKKNKA